MYPFGFGQLPSINLIVFMHMKAKLILSTIFLVASISLYAQDSSKLTKVFLQDGTTFSAYVEKQADGGYKLTTEDGSVLIYREGEISLDKPFKKSARNTQAKSSAQRQEIIQATNIPVQNLKYRDLKKIYSARDYHGYEPGDKYSPGVIGVVSFLVPGLGQYITGTQIGWGILQTVVGGACLSYGIQSSFSYGENNGIPAFAVWAGMATWSCCAAVKAAKIKNLYYRDVRNGVAYQFDVTPYFDVTSPSLASNQNFVTGLSLRVSF